MSEPANENTPDVTPSEAEVNQPSPESVLQAKLDALTAQQSAAPVQQTVDQGLADKIANIEAAISALGAQSQSASPTPGATSSLFGNVNPTVNKAPAAATDMNSIASIIEQTVQRAVKLAVEASRITKKEQTALSQQHSASFNRAVASFPDLADPNSQAAQAFDRLWNSRTDITGKLGDAPELIAEITRGLVSDVIKRDAQLGANKAKVDPAAASTPNSAAPQRQSFLPQASDTEEAGNIINELTQKGSDPTQGLSGDEMQSLISLSIAKQVGESVNRK